MCFGTHYLGEVQWWEKLPSCGCSVFVFPDLCFEMYVYLMQFLLYYFSLRYITELRTQLHILSWYQDGWGKFHRSISYILVMFLLTNYCHSISACLAFNYICILVSGRSQGKLECLWLESRNGKAVVNDIFGESYRRHLVSSWSFHLSYLCMFFAWVS